MNVITIKYFNLSQGIGTNFSNLKFKKKKHVSHSPTPCIGTPRVCQNFKMGLKQI